MPFEDRQFDCVGNLICTRGRRKIDLNKFRAQSLAKITLLNEKIKTAKTRVERKNLRNVANAQQSRLDDKLAYFSLYNKVEILKRGIQKIANEDQIDKEKIKRLISKLKNVQ